MMGSKETIEIDSWEKFEDLFFDPQYKYVLTSDISLEDKDINIISNFYGVLDGNGYAIKGLNSEDTVPIIRENNGIIKNLNIENFNIGYTENLGGLCVRNQKRIKNCHVSGNFQSQKNIGGIVVENFGFIESCSFEGTVESLGNLRVGGIAASNENLGTIEECKTSGSTKGSFRVGGITGQNSGKVKACNSNSNIIRNQKSNGPIGGIIGRNYGRLYDSYFHGGLTRDGGDEGLLVGKNNHTIENCHSKKIQNCSLIGENLGNSNKNSFKDTVKEIQKTIVANKI
mgnify:CR=1 FL=1